MDQIKPASPVCPICCRAMTFVGTAKDHPYPLAVLVCENCRIADGIKEVN